jgi:beta-galactosidase
MAGQSAAHRWLADEHGFLSQRRRTQLSLSRRSVLQLSAATVVGVCLRTRASADEASVRREICFDSDWLFQRGPALDAHLPEFDDSRWRRLDVPHDWSVEPLGDSAPESAGCPDASWSRCDAPDRVGPFDRQASVGGAKTAFTVGGIGWYRKHFLVADLDPGRQVEVRFDGVYMNADVWLNGRHLGTQRYGYSSFAFDLTPHLHGGDRPNVLVVRVRNEGDNSRWYTGSGIYRHVWLTVSPAIRIALWGVALTTDELEGDTARLSATIEIENRERAARDVSIELDIFDPQGRRAGGIGREVRVLKHSQAVATVSIRLNAPQRWSPETPQLYSARTRLRVADRVVDCTETLFGVRTVIMDAEHGLRLNGRPLKLHGACVHSDHGLLGAAAIDGAEQRKVELLKSNGFNAVRCAHNAFAPAFLDACDRAGLLVIEEAFDQWGVGKSPDDYHRTFAADWRGDLTAMIRRDRNHPSLLMWSIGNEIPEKVGTAGRLRAEQLRDEVERLDPTRAVTAAVDAGGKIRPFARDKWMPFQPAFLALDVGGYNYRWEQFEPDHLDYPQRVMYGSESLPMDAAAIWRLVERNNFVIGDFVWSGMDYLGEAGIGIVYLGDNPVPPPGEYPLYGSSCGDLDLTGQKRAQSHYRDVLWRRSTLELLVKRPTPPGQTEQVRGWAWSDEIKSWTWPAALGRMLTVQVYSRAWEVSLHLNGREVGRARPDDRHTASFELAYEPGTLLAAAYAKDGARIATTVLETVGRPARLRIALDRAQLRNDRNELAYATVEVLDAEGRFVPDAAVGLRISVEGPIELAACGNADTRDVVSFRNVAPRAFRGRALAILRPVWRTGRARLTVQSPGLAPASVDVSVVD